MITAIEHRNANLLNSNTNDWNRVFENRIPYCYRPNQIEYPMNQYDKIFASCWIGEDTVAIGTKDNQLTLWNVHQNQMKRLPLPNVTVSYDRGCGIHDIDYYQLPNNGIMVSGGDCPNEIAMFETNTCQPIGLLQGHSDWVFGCKFVTENVLFSGGKDGKILFWKCDELAKQANDQQYNQSVGNTSSFSVIHPYAGIFCENDKIRNVCVEKTRRLCYALNTNGTVGIWDAESMRHIHNEILDDIDELIAMDVKKQDNLIAVGSQQYTSIIDPRSDDDIKCIYHVDRCWGVRTVLFVDNFLIIGGGSGIVSFIDMRKPDDYHHIVYYKCQGVVRSGMIDMNENVVPQAVYTISHNFSKTNLFVGGGPLLVGVSGYFGSVWN